MLYIVMGKTTERIFEKYPIQLPKEKAEEVVAKLNRSYWRASVPITFYITPILDL